MIKTMSELPKHRISFLVRKVGVWNWKSSI